MSELVITWVRCCVVVTGLLETRLSWMSEVTANVSDGMSEFRWIPALGTTSMVWRKEEAICSASGVVDGAVPLICLGDTTTSCAAVGPPPLEHERIPRLCSDVRDDLLVAVCAKSTVSCMHEIHSITLLNIFAASLSITSVTGGQCASSFSTAHVRLHLHVLYRGSNIQLCSVSVNRDPWLQPRCNQIRVIPSRVIARIKCTMN